MNTSRMSRATVGRVLAAMTLPLLAGACGSSGTTASGSGVATTTPAPAPAAATSTTTPTPAPAPTTSSPAAAVPASVVTDPDRLRIPRIGVDATIGDLGLTPAGELEAPTDYDATGWFTDGAQPGHIGPAIIAGHVDSQTGPAVFARISELRPGDEVQVIGLDGATVTFTVDDTKQYPKAEFPTVDVYGPTTEPVLRLITCGGAFDGSTGHYIDNIIVTAST